MGDLTHVDERGQVRMVDVGLKQETRRIAVASGRIQMRPETLRLIMEGKAPKGDVFATARIAAITGTKLTPFIVPLCHSIGVTGVEVELTPCSEGGQAFVFCQVSVSTVGRTGAEMEAMAGVASSLLAIEWGQEAESPHRNNSHGCQGPKDARFPQNTAATVHRLHLP